MRLPWSKAEQIEQSTSQSFLHQTLTSVNGSSSAGTRSLNTRHLIFSKEFARYVDNTTIASLSPNLNDQSLQTAANKLSDWSRENYTKGNTQKTNDADKFR